MLLLFLPFTLLGDKKALTAKKLIKAFIPALAVTLFYAETGVFFARNGIWTFHSESLSGWFFRHLPVEQYLYYFSMSFFCLALYQYRKAKRPHKSIGFSLFLSNLLLGLCVAFLFFAYTKPYTLVLVSMTAFFLLLVEYRTRLRFMGNFYPALLWGLIPFYITQYILSHRPIITYQWDKTMNAGWLKIPFENHFLYFGMFLLGVAVLELLQNYKRP